MKKMWIGTLALCLLAAGGYVFVDTFSQPNIETSTSYSDHEAGFDAEPSIELLPNITVGAPAKYTIAELQNWQRPAGPLKVGIQVGHWQNEDMPEELENLERNTGATWNGITESEVVLVISELIQSRLQAAGIVAELLPAAVPPGYVADVFLAIHADGNTNPDSNGFKFAAPRRDYAGTSQSLVNLMYETYGAATGLRADPSVTRRMTAYYAFNWPRYEYAIHPFTPAVIVETGFLTSPVDRAIIINQPDRAAAGVADAVIQFLNDQTLQREPLPTAFTATPQLPLAGEVLCAPLRAERIVSANSYDCLPSLTDETGAIFLLANYTSSTLPVGTPFTAVGEYLPIQNLGSYFWFPYQVNGLIVDPALPMLDSWFLR